VANWLAALQVPADALNRARELLAGKDSTPLLVKQLGAQLAGLTFDGGQRQVTLPMSDPDATGTYRATFADTPVPEHYTFYVTATGVTDDGVSFRREAKQETFVLVRPEPDHTQLDIRQIAPGQVNVTMIPRDRFGNVLLLEPSTAGGFGLVAPGARIGELASNLDGTYTSTVTFHPNTNPAIGLQFGGQNIVKPAPVPPIGDLHYPNRVISFTPGAIQAANQHADPDAALGAIVGKPAGTFVSLGAGGQLVVGFYWQVILAGDDGDDITVFIQPDADLRSYRVEAYSVDDVHRGNGHWVPLGESIGVTQSFSLRRAALVSAFALRITDTSGRTRDADLKPLSTPGVSVRGVGALKIGKLAPEPWPLVRQGSRGHPVQTLQYLLGAHGHPVTVDGIFGPDTDAAVRAFQQAGHLTVDGLVGPETWSALIVQASLGSTGDAVRAVQEEFQFRDLSGDLGTGLQVDGIFGPKTDAAVRGFQQALGLAVDGIVGPQTWLALVSGMLSL
jgi:peptidoglycan hydrolase-like protein with peptidoglycan-binding domain